MLPKTNLTGDPGRQKRKLIVVHNSLDDEGGADHVAQHEPYKSTEGGKYVMPAIGNRIDWTRFQVEELGVISMNIPENPGNPKAKYVDVIAQSALAGINQVHEAFMSGHKVLSLGGNHVRALDVIGAMRACHELRIPFGLIWIDEHLDFNTPETTPSGNIHGMVSAVLQGRGAKELLVLLKNYPFVDPRNIIYVGPREDQMDGHETKDEHGNYAESTEVYCFTQLIQRGARCFTAESMKVNDKKIDYVSAEAKTAVKELSDRIQAAGGKLWIEWDVDVVDSNDMPAAVMKNDNGLSAAQMRDLFEFMEGNCVVDGMGVSEICPVKDIKGIGRELIAVGVSKILGVGQRGSGAACKKRT
jgi:arginase family enzyme